MPKIAQMMAVTASIGQNEKWNCTVAGSPGTARRLTCPSHSSGVHRADHSGLSWPEAAMPYP